MSEVLHPRVFIIVHKGENIHRHLLQKNILSRISIKKLPQEKNCHHDAEKHEHVQTRMRPSAAIQPESQGVLPAQGSIPKQSQQSVFRLKTKLSFKKKSDFLCIHGDLSEDAGRFLFPSSDWPIVFALVSEA